MLFKVILGVSSFQKDAEYVWSHLNLPLFHFLMSKFCSSVIPLDLYITVHDIISYLTFIWRTANNNANCYIQHKPYWHTFNMTVRIGTPGCCGDDYRSMLTLVLTTFFDSLNETGKNWEMQTHLGPVIETDSSFFFSSYLDVSCLGDLGLEFVLFKITCLVLGWMEFENSRCPVEVALFIFGWNTHTHNLIFYCLLRKESVY